MLRSCNFDAFPPRSFSFTALADCNYVALGQTEAAVVASCSSTSFNPLSKIQHIMADLMRLLESHSRSIKQNGKSCAVCCLIVLHSPDLTLSKAANSADIRLLAQGVSKALVAAYETTNDKPWPGFTVLTAAYASSPVLAEDKISAIKQQEEILRKVSTGAMQLGYNSTLRQQQQQ
jgi:hypothetical protein